MPATPGTTAMSVSRATPSPPSAISTKPKPPAGLDAHGLVVAPGFIDIHTHARRGIFLDPFAKNYIHQGVTTIMEGPDGSSPLPIAPFLAKVAAAHPAPNFGTFAGQGSIREQVMGLVNRPATPEEIEKMRQIARQAMLDGAFGVTTGLFYVPGNFTPTEEVIEIEKVVGAMGGMHHSHMRDEASHVARQRPRDHPDRRRGRRAYPDHSPQNHR